MKGIYFQPYNVTAIVEGRKSQTRRVIKPCSTATVVGRNANDDLDNDVPRVQPDWVFTEAKPRYHVGETVYLKETYCHFSNAYRGSESVAFVKYAGGSVVEHVFTGDPPKQKWWNTGKPLDYMQNLRTMPAWAARYFITITDVRAERLQSITEEDAIAEGCDKEIMPGIELPSAKRRYSYLWDSINKPPYDWQSNPYVWVYSFKQEDK